MCACGISSCPVTTLLCAFDGNNAGSRKLPRQYWRGLEIPNIIYVAGRRRRGDDSRFSWCRVGRRPITILAKDRRAGDFRGLREGRTARKPPCESGSLDPRAFPVIPTTPTDELARPDTWRVTSGA